MRAKLISLLIAILVLADPIQCQLSVDNSLWAACNQTGTSAGFKQRSVDDPSEGDKCTLAFNVAVRDDDDAREFCSLYAPWRLVRAEIDVKDRPRVLCHVEATLACKNGWIQMFGYCFRMTSERKLANHADAQTQCNNLEEGATIASLRHKNIVGVWRRYFRGIAQIWVTASETWHQYIQKTGTVDGDAFAIAFTGKHYDFSVHPNSLIRIDPKIKLQVLCEYKPPMTSAEINYLGRRYSEIYYPSVKVPNGILVRSASSYTTSTNNLEICKKALLPYMVGGVDPFLPDAETLAAIHGTKLPFTLLTGSGARAGINTENMASKECVNEKKKLLVEALKKDDSKHEVDGVEGTDHCDNMNTAAIVHEAGAAKLKTMSDSRSLPIWCKLGRKMEFRYNTTPGYEIFHRSNGEVVAHRLYSQRLTYDAASKICKENGGFLSGINSLDEADHLGKLATEAGLKNEAIFLGGRRKEACIQLETDHTNPDALCATNRVIEWQDNVAQDFHTKWWRNGHDTHKNPSSTVAYLQECLTYVQGTPSWANNDTTAFLDDYHCGIGSPFFCTNKVTVTPVDPL
ncbi:hypothetical protein GCK72_007223 [Caenorhabditis remanei]|uniref:C-type lectin domain-containing protein n=1 Tax=Caenorhabditis remanei TaxID=31234 RepID=A0A6A5HKY6_CAERE|nr:hypothetical protein GCK72_007223 [Caenorhabditis remanei]KAF1767264.1 hypothetical protein GCK72_007223 [Caenorhabditis remanei]